MNSDVLTNIDDPSLEVVGSDASGNFLWSRINKVNYEGEDYYSVQYNYIKPKIDEVSKKTHHGEIIIAKATCSKPKEATIINVLFFNEQLEYYHYIGTVLVFGGVYMVKRKV